MTMHNISDQQVFERLQALCASAMRAPFYQSRIPAVPQTIQEFQAIPFLTRQEVFDNTYPRSTAMFSVPQKNMIVSSTGGSSGIARYTLLTHTEWDKMCQLQADALRLIGITEEDSVANLMVAGSMWPSFLGAHEIIKKIGATHLPISANIAIEKIVSLCLDFQPTAMMSLPTFFVLLSDIANKEKIKFDKLRTIAYAGEHMSKEVRNYVGESLGVDNIRALAYTSADAGLMGYQRDGCQPNQYLLPKAHQYIEIYDFENNRLCEPGEKGEVVVTCLEKHAMPIIRYRLGDVAHFIQDTQPLGGDENPMFELAGRAGEDFKLGGAYISMDVFEEILGEFAGKDGISMNHALVLDDVHNQMDIILKIESADPALARQQTELIKTRIKENIPEVEAGLKMNFLRHFDVTFVTSGDLERSPITGKVKRLHDKRVLES